MSKEPKKEDVVNTVKNWSKAIYCSNWTWGFIAILIVAFIPLNEIRNEIGSDWYLWSMLIVMAFLLLLIYKATVKFRKLVDSDYMYMGIFYCLGFFLCIASPLYCIYESEDIERLLKCFSAFGPLVVGFATVIFASKQRDIQEEQKIIESKQHNLELFNKRWALLEELKILGAQAESIKHNKETNSDTENNRHWSLIKNELDTFSTKCSILFDSEMEEACKEISEKFTNLHTTIDEELNWEKYHKDYPENYPEKLGGKLLNEKITLHMELCKSLASFYNDMLNFIKKEKINKD